MELCGAVLCKRCLQVLGADPREASPGRAIAADKRRQGRNQVAASGTPGVCLVFRARGGCEDAAAAAWRIAACRARAFRISQTAGRWCVVKTSAPLQVHGPFTLSPRADLEDAPVSPFFVPLQPFAGNASPGSENTQKMVLLCPRDEAVPHVSPQLLLTDPSSASQGGTATRCPWS